MADDGTGILEAGPAARLMHGAYHRAIAAIASAGVNVIVDEVMISEAECVDWQEALTGLPVQWVAVRCDLDVVVERERQRGDRYLGLARGTGLVVHDHATYDFEVDTTSMTTQEVAAELDEKLG